eukprot:maker-scaffold_1-snap-gene-12.33-mRNA-1 protein AED:0.18 eAED:0.18 QI:111/1/1/1/1/1/3/364/402
MKEENNQLNNEGLIQETDVCIARISKFSFHDDCREATIEQRTKKVGTYARNKLRHSFTLEKLPETPEKLSTKYRNSFSARRSKRLSVESQDSHVSCLLFEKNTHRSSVTSATVNTTCHTPQDTVRNISQHNNSKEKKSPMKVRESLQLFEESLGIANLDWKKQNEMIEILKYLISQDEKKIFPYREQSFSFLLSCADSLRSALSKNALGTFKHLFSAKFSPMNLSPVVSLLLSKSVNDKRFIASSAKEALDSLVSNLFSEDLVATFLTFSSGRNQKIQAESCSRAFQVLKKLDQQMKKNKIEKKQFTINVDLIVTSFKEFFNSRSVEAKTTCQPVLRILHTYSDKENFQRSVEKELSNMEKQQLTKVLAKKPRKRLKRNGGSSIRELVMLRRKESQQQNFRQ